MLPVPLDEYPIHQAPLSLRYVASSDRNFYDRSYFNAHDRTGDLFFVTGLGVYPNLGVIDAYATVRRGDRQWTIRCSDALGDERLAPSVGPYRVEVVEPLQRIRLVCDGDDHGLGFDLHVGGLVPRRHGAAPRHARRARGPSSTPPASRRWAPGRASSASTATTCAVVARRLGRHPGPVLGHPARGRGRAGRASGRRPHRRAVVAVRPAAVRRLRRRGHRAGAARRLPHAERRHPGVARRPGRAAGLAGGRDHLPVRHPACPSGPRST